MALNLKSSGGGSVTLDVPSTASNYTATIQAADGTLSPLISDTAVASTSGTSIDFTGIPSWVKRITVMFSGVSTTGANKPFIRIGHSGGLENSGYSGGTQNFTTTPTSVASAASTDWPIQSTAAANAIYGALTIFNISGNTWVISGTVYPNSVSMTVVNGSKTLTDVLNQVSIQTADTFDAGSINIMYE